MKSKLILLFLLGFSLLSYSQDVLTESFNYWFKNEVKYKLKLEDTIHDFDNNVYHMQRIGNQIWLIENLKVRHFSNGDSIPTLDNNKEWTTTLKPACSIVTGKISHSYDTCDAITSIEFKTNEIFYNQFVVLDHRNVCPVGFHVPDSSEYSELIFQVSKYFPIDTEITEQFSDRYETEYIGFQEFPFGYRSSVTGEFAMYNSHGYWWTRNKGFAVGAWYRSVIGYDLYITNPNWESWKNNSGCSIKCIKD